MVFSRRSGLIYVHSNTRSLKWQIITEKCAATQCLSRKKTSANCIRRKSMFKATICSVRNNIFYFQRCSAMHEANMHACLRYAAKAVGYGRAGFRPQSFYSRTEYERSNTAEVSQPAHATIGPQLVLATYASVLRDENFTGFEWTVARFHTARPGDAVDFARMPWTEKYHVLDSGFCQIGARYFRDIDCCLRYLCSGLLVAFNRLLFDQLEVIRGVRRPNVPVVDAWVVSVTN